MSLKLLDITRRGTIQESSLVSGMFFLMIGGVNSLSFSLYLGWMGCNHQRGCFKRVCFRPNRCVAMMSQAQVVGAGNPSRVLSPQLGFMTCEVLCRSCGKLRTP